jgi:hypothetical protein
MRALLTATDLFVDFGCELLDPSLNIVSDLSSDVSSIVVKRDNLANVHGTVELTISRVLAWGRDRIRPYMLLSSLSVGVSNVRWNLGIFLLNTPETALAESPASFTVTGMDLLYLLQDNIGDSYSVGAGANVLTAVRVALTEAGITTSILLDSTAADKALVTPIVFPQSENPSWLGVVNALLAAINYRGIWADQDGALRSGPYVEPALRPSEYDLDVADLVSGVVAEDRRVSNDLWAAPNWFRYIQNGLTTAPTEGAGQYTHQNPSLGLSSQASVGRIVHAPVVYLDAVDQASLVAQGVKLATAAMRVTEVLTFNMSPLPCGWHADMWGYSDAALGDPRKLLCRSWALPLTGEDGSYVMETA